jgi:hypothetical protein
MIERDTALRHAQDWVDAWNAHDPERVVADFADDVVVTSPMIEQIRPGSGGVLRDKASVLSYYRDGLAASYIGSAPYMLPWSVMPTAG